FDDFNSKFFRLLALMSIHGADADLDQALGGSLFHDARKWASVRQPAALEIVVEIGVGIEMEDGQSRNPPCESSNDGKSNRVVATKRDWAQTLVKQLADLGFDRGKGLMGVEFQIARIAISPFGAQITPGLRPRVRRIGVEGHADDRRRSGRSTQPGRVGIEWDAQKNRGSGLGRIGTKCHRSSSSISLG